jgi:hypothetical protein
MPAGIVMLGAAVLLLLRRPKDTWCWDLEASKPIMDFLAIMLPCTAAAEVPANMQPGGLWLDENGLMLYEPNPAKVGRLWQLIAMHGVPAGSAFQQQEQCACVFAQFVTESAPPPVAHSVFQLVCSSSCVFIAC